MYVRGQFPGGPGLKPSNHIEADKEMGNVWDAFPGIATWCQLFGAQD